MVEVNLEEHREDMKFPIIGDFHMSEQFGLSFKERKCPTNTKQRAKARAFFLINKHLEKRRLTMRDMATLQGWTKDLQQTHLGIGTKDPQQSSLPDSKLLEALGNGFSCNVLEAIFKNLLLARI